MDPIVEKSDDDKLWEQVQQDRSASTSAESNPVTPEPQATDADPLASLPEPTRKMIEELNAKILAQDGRLADVGQKLATAHGTMGNMKQQLEQSRLTLEKLTPTLEAVEAGKKAADQTVADEKQRKREELRERLKDIPDVLEYFDEMLPPVADAKPAEVKPAEVEKKDDPPAPAAIDPDVVRVLTLQRELSDVSPGWMTKRDSAEFKAWAPKQSAEVQAKLASWDVKDAASVFAAFDTHLSDAAKVAKVEADRQERLRRGESVTGRGSSNGNNVDTSDDALWKKVQQDRARARAA